MRQQGHWWWWRMWLWYTGWLCWYWSVLWSNHLQTQGWSRVCIGSMLQWVQSMDFSKKTNTGCLTLIIIIIIIILHLNSFCREAIFVVSHPTSVIYPKFARVRLASVLLTCTRRMESRVPISRAFASVDFALIWMYNAHKSGVTTVELRICNASSNSTPRAR